MKKEELKKLIDTAAGRIPADTVIKNCQEEFPQIQSLKTVRSSMFFPGRSRQATSH